ncbi:hypothetical protein KSF_109990 [Reticulibacter mediterranei]|uniref:Uncharacterized protein n=1 Tax=Reticulibacter mediterranei TaxID=2778369 RepID=A0A8J3J3M2_9CHLR|nr:hypothetical protein KSF_109990 [Reticulibacter mediterranei]
MGEGALQAPLSRKLSVNLSAHHGQERVLGWKMVLVCPSGGLLFLAFPSRDELYWMDEYVWGGPLLLAL